MTKQDDIDLAIRYGGYMETDKNFLENILPHLDDMARHLFLVPPPSVINAYFSELYQKKRPEEAVAYFFGMSKAFKMFVESPEFGLEGQPGFELFRFIRLNVDGKAYGYSYRNDEEEAIIFQEIPETVTQNLLFKFAQIFPSYLIFEDEGVVRMRPPFDFSPFEDEREITALTSAVENKDFIKFYGYNIEDIIHISSQTFGGATYLQYQPQRNQFIIYRSKGG